MDEDTELVERLVANRLCGDVATPVGSCLANCRLLVTGDPGYTFGLSDGHTATFEDAVTALEALGGGRLRGHPDDAPAFIDPSGTLAGIRRHRATLAAVAACGRARVLLATGHPILLPHYGAVARALVSAGCELLRPLDGAPEIRSWGIAYVDGVAALSDDGELRHTHHAQYMETMLAGMRGGPPDLVVADHGFAGAAIEAGIPTLSIADVNDPALPLAQALGRTDGVLLIDDGIPPEGFATVTDAVLAWETG